MSKQTISDFCEISFINNSISSFWSFIYSEGLCWKKYATLNPSEMAATQLYKLTTNGKTVGQRAKVKTSAGVAVIEKADIVATNGVIHAIDTVV